MSDLEFEKIIGYSFKNKTLIKTALSHSSYANEKGLKSNERLEFLGDSVLSLIVSGYLFEHMKLEDEGKLTKIRASLVCEQSLAELAHEIQLSKFIKLGKGEEITGGRARSSILSDAYEAVIAAVYLDSNIETTRKWLLSKMMKKLNEALKGEIIIDYKSKLQEIIQTDNTSSLKYELIEETGPDHNKHFKMGVLIDDKLIGVGEGQTKKEAEREAARNALKK